MTTKEAKNAAKRAKKPKKSIFDSMTLSNNDPEANRRRAIHVEQAKRSRMIPVTLPKLVF